MSDIMRPMAFGHLMNWILEEYRRAGSVFGVADPVKHTNGQALPIFEEKIEAPFGPAAGPNTQLAQNIIAAYLLDPALEEKIRKAVRQTSGGSYLAMDPTTVRSILTVVKRTIGDLSKIPQKPVIIVSVDIRRYFRKMIEKDYYELPVLSFQELSQEINIQPLGRLKL